MPSIARIIGWCLAMVLAAPLAAQTTAPSLPSQGSWREAGPRDGTARDARREVLPPVDPFEREAPSGPAANRPGSVPEVVPTQYTAPVAGADPAAQASAVPPTAGVALSRPEKKAAALPLPPPSRIAGEGAAKTPGSVPSLVTAAASLAIVLGLFFLLAWAIRRKSPSANTVLPQEVVEVLGRAPLSGRQQLHLLRCGRKLLLVSVTPSGAETLTEITEPTEVDRLAGLCMQARPNSATVAFRQVFEQFASRGTDGEELLGQDRVTSDSGREVRHG